MTPDTLRRIVEHVGICQRHFAQALGVSDRTLRRWLSGAQPIPEGAAADIRQVALPFVCRHADPRCEDDPCPAGVQWLCNAPADHPARQQDEAQHG